MSWNLKLSPKALADIENALDWTSEKFGAAQRSEYVDLIGLAIEDITADPRHFRSRSRSDLHPNARVIHIGRRGRHARHIFVYRTAGISTIDVARFLHDSMDPKRQAIDWSDD